MPAGVGSTGVLAMGEIILRDDEVPAVFAEAHRQGVRVTALHNLLPGDITDDVRARNGAGRFRCGGEEILLLGAEGRVAEYTFDDGSPHFWVHWYATGDETTLTRGVAATLTHMNSARKAVAEP